MVRGPFPVELTITVLVAAVFNATLPNARLFVLIVMVGETAFSCSARVLAALPAVAVSMTDCGVFTCATLTVKPMLEAFAGMTTLAGNAMTALLLERCTFIPVDGAGALSVTVHESVPAPVKEVLAQVRSLSAAVFGVVPVPLRPTFIVGFTCELLITVTCPVVAPAVTGSNLTVSSAD